MTLVQPYPLRERAAGAWQAVRNWMRVVQPAPPATPGVALILLLLLGGGSGIALAYLTAVGTPPQAGMLLTAQELLSRGGVPSREAIRRHLSGNYCRCTGYQAIVDAVESVARRRAEARA